MNKSEQVGRHLNKVITPLLMRALKDKKKAEYNSTIIVQKRRLKAVEVMLQEVLESADKSILELALNQVRSLQNCPQV